jgi:hypothetical protein
MKGEWKMRKKVIFCIALSLFLSSCNPTPQEPRLVAFTVGNNFQPPTPPVEIAIEFPYEPVKNAPISDVDIWFDGTPSMAGFLPQGRNIVTTYTLALPTLEDTAYGLGSQNVRKFRYDIGFPSDNSRFIALMDELEISEADAMYEIMALPKSSNSRIYDAPEFYSKRTYYNDRIFTGDVFVRYVNADDQRRNPTRYKLRRFAQDVSRISYEDQEIPPLRFALSNLNVGNLSVIVTDMYEEKSLIHNAFAELSRLSAGADDFSVSLIGVRSEFAGRIHDIGEADISIVYGTPEQMLEHPFYILVIGKSSDVFQFTETFVSKLSSKIQKPDIQSHSFTDVKQWHSVSDSVGLVLTNGRMLKKESEGVFTFDLGERPAERRRGEAPEISPIELTATLTYTFSIYEPYTAADLSFVLGWTACKALRVNIEGNSQIFSDEVLSNNGKYSWYLIDNVEFNDNIAKINLTTVNINKGKDNGDGVVEYNIEAFISFNIPSEKGIYYISGRPLISFSADSFENRLPTWISEWSIDVYQPTEWLNDISTFPGGRTLYLSAVARGIQNALKQNDIQTEITLPAFSICVKSDYS